MADCTEMCETCVHAQYDYEEYFGGYRKYFLDGCKKDLEPYYNEEEEAVECDGYKGVGYAD